MAPGVSGARGPTGAIGPIGPTFRKLSDIGVVIVNTPEYCEFFKNLPTWVFDYQQLHQTIEQLNSKFIVQTDKAYVNFVNCFVRSPVYSFDNFDVLYHCDMALVKKTYQIRSKNSDIIIYNVHETHASFISFTFPLNEGVQLINLANNPELINFI